MKIESGCGGVMAVLLLVAILAIVVLYGLDQLANSEAGRLNAEANRIYAQARLEVEQARARAMVIEAQGQARLDSALASQVLMASALPWAVLVVLGLLGLGVLYLMARRPVGPQIIYLAHPGWQVLPDGRPALVAGQQQSEPELSVITSDKWS